MIHIHTFRKYLQVHNVKHWQYLMLGFLTSIFCAILWYYYSVITEIDFIVIPLIAALMQGLLAYLFMETKGEARKVFFTLVFSFFTYFLGKYLLFEQYYDWFLNAYVDKNHIDLSLILFYFKTINIESIQLFIAQSSLMFTVKDFLWIGIIFIFSLLYLVLPFDKKYNIESHNHSKMFRKRRFE